MSSHSLLQLSLDRTIQMLIGRTKPAFLMFVSAFTIGAYLRVSLNPYSNTRCSGDMQGRDIKTPFSDFVTQLRQHFGVSGRRLFQALTSRCGVNDIPGIYRCSNYCIVLVIVWCIPEFMYNLERDQISVGILPPTLYGRVFAGPLWMMNASVKGIVTALSAVCSHVLR